MAACPGARAFSQVQALRDGRVVVTPAREPVRGADPGIRHHTERNPVNKSELVSAIAKRADVSASTVDSVLSGLQDELVDAITRGEKVAVSGLITVERTQRSARTGRNPQTGESIDIPAANTVKVTAGSNLKKAASNVPV